MAFKIIDGNGYHAVTSELDDIDSLVRGKAPPPGRSILEKRIDGKGTGWDSDPDRGTTEQRLAGDFKWAMDYMKTLKNITTVGNIKSIEPDRIDGLTFGTEVDFDAYLSGDPRCLGVYVPNENDDGERVIRIAVGVGGLCNVDATELVKRVAVTLKAVQEYESAGYACEVFSMSCSEGENGKLYYSIIDCSKATMAQILSACASTRIFRGPILHLKGILKGIDWGLGATVTYDQTYKVNRMKSQVREMLGNNTVVIASAATPEQIAKEFESMNR